jgi:hypothetical protein
MMVSRIRDGLATNDSPLTAEDVMGRADYRDLMTARAAGGELAPDFELPTLEGAQTVQLSSLYAERPVALVFGSYT